MTTNSLLSATTSEIPGNSAYPAAVRMRGVPADLFSVGHGEPSLDEMLADEVMRQMMARDGVATVDLLTLIDEVRHRLR